MTRIPEIKERFLELAGVMDLRAFVSGWFHDAPFEVRGLVASYIATKHLKLYKLGSNAVVNHPSDGPDAAGGPAAGALCRV